jgi:hypothetical protein
MSTPTPADATTGAMTALPARLKLMTNAFPNLFIFDTPA